MYDVSDTKELGDHKVFVVAHSFGNRKKFRYYATMNDKIDFVVLMRTLISTKNAWINCIQVMKDGYAVEWVHNRRDDVICCLTHDPLEPIPWLP